MNNLLQIFEKPEFGQIRTVTIDGEPWFVGKDVATALGYEKPTDAARRMVNDEDKGVSVIDTPGGEQEMIVINEAGVYSLIFGSRLDTAKEFKHWVTHEVLPTIRKHGYFTTIPKDQLFEELKLELGYDHFIEDTVLPMLEAQEEYTFKELWENYCGFPIRTKEDWGRASAIFEENAKERKQRMTSLCHSILDYMETPEQYAKLRRFPWNAAENKGHSRIIRGVRWFDDYILRKITQL